MLLAKIAQNVHILQQLFVEVDALFGAHDALHEVPAPGMQPVLWPLTR